MATRTTPVGTQTASDYLSAAEYNGAAGGWIGYVEITSPISGFTHVNDDLTGLTVTVTVGTTRRIKITGFYMGHSNTADDDLALNIQEGGTVLQSSTVSATRSTNSYNVICVAVETPSSGSHTYKLTGGKSGGTGSVTIDASSTNPAFILVEDLGPQ